MWRRLAAFAYDLMLLAAVVFSFTLAVLALRLGAAIPPGSAWFSGSVLLLSMLFFCGFWVNGGQTLGMRAWRVRVVRDDGRPLAWPRAVARFAAGIASALPAGLGLWWSVFDEHKRSWHDRWTRTRVVRIPEQKRR